MNEVSSWTNSQIFSNAYWWMKIIFISIPISLKFIPKGPIDNKSALLQVMAWCRTGDKPLPDPVHQRIYAAPGGDDLKY